MVEGYSEEYFCRNFGMSLLLVPSADGIKSPCKWSHEITKLGVCH
jgi:hypothetical protein